MRKYFKISDLKINNNIPEENGVYFFWDKNKNILYIGKSTNLKKRFSSYFSNSILYKTEKMISQAVFYSYIKVDSEIQALLLEAELIKKHQPKFNIELKDDKRPLYIKITSEKYPRVLTARKIDKKDYLDFFGPFPSSGSVKDVLRLLRKIFPYSKHKIGRRACLDSQIGLCKPCPSVIEQLKDTSVKKQLKKEYLKNIRNIVSLLSGKNDSLRISLTKDMQHYSDNNNFEKAIQIRDQLQKLEYITEKPKSIKEFLKNPNFLEDQRRLEIVQLEKILSIEFNKNIKAKRIECFDVAHLQGSNTAASMVTFINAQPDKTYYRHFRIRQKKGNDDVSSLKEVATRRSNHFSDWGKPDLIIVDGGKPQVGIFFKIFSKYNLPVIGLAKRFELVVIPKKTKNTIKYSQLNLQSLACLNLLIRLRNESHRFAQKYHHKLVEKSFFN